MKERTRDPWRLVVAILGIGLTVAGVVMSLIQNRRKIAQAVTSEEVALEAAATTEPTAEEPPAERVAVELSVDDTGLPDVMPRLNAVLNFTGPGSLAIRRVCLAWNGDTEECCAHVADVTTQSCMLSPVHPRATYVFDLCPPARLQDAMAARDLSLHVYSTGEEEPVRPFRRKSLLRHMERWLSALDAYYSVHNYDRTLANPELSRRAA